MPRRRRNKSKNRIPTQSRAESRISQQFNKLDLDSDGVLSKSELITHFQSQGMSSSWVHGLLATGDRNGDGCIDFTEFRRICLSIEKDPNTPYVWTQFVGTFGQRFANEMKAGQAAINQTIEPFQHNLRQASIRVGNSPITANVRGKRRAIPPAYRVGAECLDCCCFMPLCGIVLLCLLSPALTYLTDDIYRVSKDTLCALKLPHRTMSTRHLPSIEQWCDPNNGCPESYQFLGISRTATTQQIRRSFRRKSLEVHPDKACAPKELERNNMDVDDCDIKFTKLFVCLEEAKQTLMDPKKRKYYDDHGNLDGIENLLMDYTWTATAVGAGLIAYVFSYAVLLMFRSCGCPGQGPGKYMLGVEVVDSTGAVLGRGKMLLRSMVKLVVLVSFPFLLWIVFQLLELKEAAYVITGVFVVLSGVYNYLDHHVVWKEVGA